MLILNVRYLGRIAQLISRKFEIDYVPARLVRSGHRRRRCFLVRAYHFLLWLEDGRQKDAKPDCNIR